MNIQEAIKKWEATGRVAYHFPRKHKVSLNGGRTMTEKEAIEYIITSLKCFEIMKEAINA